ncbi:MAG: hypothetical protein HC859_07670 [Bacteroidia bacterium]|nr:hypothetical protein [Bacteroidia bacterium]
MKTFKNLFIKDDEEDDDKPEASHGFPVTGSNQSRVESASASPFLEEIVEVYEKGLQSINMPGYDFYDFFLAIKAAGAQNEAVYKMAFQMGKTLDPSITADKLMQDAEYYVSKINEVYKTYSEQGRSKLNGLEAQQGADKQKLSNDVARVESEIARMKQQIMAMEATLTETRADLAKVDGAYKPQRDQIQQKLAANDQAMHLCVQKLNGIKENIAKYLR